jgi:hypothetical protein
MNMKKIALGFAVFALTVASAANTYTITLYQPTKVNGATFKPGDVKVELKDGSVVLKQGKTSAEAKAKVEQGGEKFANTTVGVDGDSKDLKEIRLGGTNTKLSFEKAGSASGNE